MRHEVKHLRAALDRKLPEPRAAGDGWVMHHHAGFHGRAYWASDDTGETTWAPPEGTSREAWDRGVNGRIGSGRDADGSVSLLLPPPPPNQPQ